MVKKILAIAGGAVCGFVGVTLHQGCVTDRIFAPGAAPAIAAGTASGEESQSLIALAEPRDALADRSIGFPTNHAQDLAHRARLDELEAHLNTLDRLYRQGRLQECLAAQAPKVVTIVNLSAIDGRSEPVSRVSLTIPRSDRRSTILALLYMERIETLLARARQAQGDRRRARFLREAIVELRTLPDTARQRASLESALEELAGSHPPAVLEHEIPPTARIGWDHSSAEWKRNPARSAQSQDPLEIYRQSQRR